MAKLSFFSNKSFFKLDGSQNEQHKKKELEEVSNFFNQRNLLIFIKEIQIENSNYNPNSNNNFFQMDNTNNNNFSMEYETAQQIKSGFDDKGNSSYNISEVSLNKPTSYEGSPSKDYSCSGKCYIF